MSVHVPAAQAKKPEYPVQTGPSRILVVDDEPDLERLVRLRLRRDIRAGRFELEFAHNGVEALEVLARSEPFDMVLSDINMPRMDGLALLDQIPKVDPDVRAVIVSAYGDMKNIRTAMNRGAFDFITKPIDFDDLRVTIDRTLRNLVEWRKALEARNQLVALENELEIARRMQRSILPADFPNNEHYNVHANMRPARAVGGDFYDLVKLEDNRIGIGIADVSGKGVSAALFMMSARTLLKGSAIGSPYPGEVLANVNQILNEDNVSMLFVTMLYGIYDPATGEFTYACGGHDAPVVVHPDGSATELDRTGGIALGVMPDLEYSCNTAKLEPGETIVVFTDGVTEAQDGNAAQFGMNRLCRVYEGGPPSNAEDACNAMFKAVTDFAGEAPQFDDITCATLHRKRGSA